MSEVIQLATPLPCGVQRDGDLCGRPATVAYASQNTQLAFPLTGTWTVQPVCRECTLATLENYASHPEAPTYFSTAGALRIAAEEGWEASNVTAATLRTAATRGDIIGENDEVEGWSFEENSLRLYLRTHKPRKRKSDDPKHRN